MPVGRKDGEEKGVRNGTKSFKLKKTLAPAFMLESVMELLLIRGSWETQASADWCKL